MDDRPKSSVYRVGQKNGLFLKVDNFATVSDRIIEMRVICRQNLANFIQKKIPNLHVSALNILCLICINIHCP